MTARLPRIFALTAFAALVSFAPGARAETDCGDLTADLRGLTLKYQRVMADIGDARRQLAYLPRGQEAVLRAVGRFASLSATARGERERILQLYRDAVAQECWQFEKANLDHTSDVFARATAGEEETLVGTRRVLSGLASVVK
jgi:hypothetical protein